tara:strand:+ start:42 stop:548 length:507 start_codon:yes stop_codon:yes gene_type:complete
MFVADLLAQVDELIGGLSSGSVKFDGVDDMRKAGYSPTDLPELSSVIRVYADLDREANGGVRTRYRRVFEHLAAWIYLGEQLGFLGQKAECFVEKYAEAGIDQAIAIAAYVAAVQCKNPKMFSEGFFDTPEDGKPPDCALTAALSIRYHRKQGRREVTIIGGEGRCRV